MTECAPTTPTPLLRFLRPHLYPGLHLVQRTVLVSQAWQVGARAGWHEPAATPGQRSSAAAGALSPPSPPALPLHVGAVSEVTRRGSGRPPDTARRAPLAPEHSPPSPSLAL